MMTATFRITTLVFIFANLLIGGQVANAKPMDCYAIFDAGSSGTRLYLYEDSNGTWIRYEGSKLRKPLAKPVLENNEWRSGLGARDVGWMIRSSMLRMMNKGPEEKTSPWKGFKATCNLRAIDIYATAGMRLAEQKYPERSRRLWSAVIQPLRQMLESDKMKHLLGSDVQVHARTLTGFEEGLYAWLALRDAKKKDNFGIIEMGGASAQIAFPCEQCEDALPVTIGGTTRKLFSYSFLGAGSTEAYKIYEKNRQSDQASDCDLGVEQTRPQWKPQDCSRTFSFTTAAGGIRDFYNYGPKGVPGRVVTLPKAVSTVPEWYATGAFGYLKKDDIEKTCGEGKGGHNQKKGCFLSVYFRDFISKLGVREYHPSSSDWTLGAVICDRDHCLPESPRPQCHWLPKGCLEAAN